MSPTIPCGIASKLRRILKVGLGDTTSSRRLAATRILALVTALLMALFSVLATSAENIPIEQLTVRGTTCLAESTAADHRQ